MDDMPALPLSRRQALVVAGALALVLVLAGKLLTDGSSSHPPPAFRVAATPPAAPPRLVVDVAGAVRHPGLYRLRPGLRIADAVASAGGATDKASLDGVNLAAPLADGEQVVVPARVPGGGAAAAPTGSEGGAAGPVSLSTATAEQLDALPGIGPVTTELSLSLTASLAHCSLLELVVGKHRQLLRYDHTPGVEDELEQLVLVDGVETDDEPLEAHVRRLRTHELVRVRLERRLALLLWEGKAHERLVTGKRQIDDLSDAELDPAADEDLV